MGLQTLEREVSCRSPAGAEAKFFALQQSSKGGSLESEQDVASAVARFVGKEALFATASASTVDSVTSPRPGDSRQECIGEYKFDMKQKHARPGLDFVDRLWISVLSHCATGA